MLILSRHREEAIVIDFNRVCQLIDTDPEEAKKVLSTRPKIVVASIRGDKVRIGFEVHPVIAVHRNEVQEAIDRDRQAEGGVA